MHYSKERPSSSTFRVITANFQVSEILGFLRYVIILEISDICPKSSAICLYTSCLLTVILFDQFYLLLQAPFPIQNWPYFPKFCIYSPKYNEKYLSFPKCKGTGSFPKSEVKTLVHHVYVVCLCESVTWNVCKSVNYIDYIYESVKVSAIQQ